MTKEHAPPTGRESNVMAQTTSLEIGTEKQKCPTQIDHPIDFPRLTHLWMWANTPDKITESALCSGFQWSVLSGPGLGRVDI
ncbi:hypothetical protein CGLO_07020 [Colletotrichum gloeosporioides Cg-14]|uniref:Uncharacterized protein n=1 Tax=Colletotrichum gloeosporioides (strain Cg-14) TaxID=1237896 RepID=T0KK90_COLGC|nr:hypothetical protein CGLO_07020 [Colletotrichum gloeosporioides Cg-14]